jgi:hypothetical protein
MHGHVQWVLVVATLAGAASASAQDRAVQVSVGYAFAQFLEEDGASAPIGAYLSLSGTKRVTAELDLGYQSYLKETGDVGFTVHTFTATLGPRFSWGHDGPRPYVRVLGGLRHDSSGNPSNTSWGGQAGAGLDVRIGDAATFRLGADFQIFFADGFDVKTLRLLAGITF